MCSEGYGSWVRVCVCVCVCLLSHISPLEGLFVLKTDTTYSAGNEGQKICRFFVKLLRSKVIVWNKSKKANMLMMPHLIWSLPLCTLWKHQKLLKGQVVSLRLHLSATYEYSYPVGARNNQLWARGCALYACVYIPVTCMYNLVHVLSAGRGFALSAFHSKCNAVCVSSKLGHASLLLM